LREPGERNTHFLLHRNDQCASLSLLQHNPSGALTPPACWPTARQLPNRGHKKNGACLHTHRFGETAAHLAALTQGPPRAPVCDTVSGGTTFTRWRSPTQCHIWDRHSVSMVGQIRPELKVPS
jgi:hypothetical protein